ncbi:putative pentatricopeptide repeat-containing protein At1g19290 isoform X4 [Salvia hispanica]|uniref:putative pentatricopeptide repeat-containing protein At1g19290 isoform X4 n=1 Tax=Salvia hispanica TaxID=49212 RepID=UPI0020098899|nr:putative pentatricopeptide repeat-containing protein At1g19290 isoform X4 [Salvia hispanica]
MAIASQISRLLILRRFDALKSLSFTFSDHLVNAVLKSLKLHPVSALHFFDLASKQNHFRPHFKSYVKIVHILSNARMFDETRLYLRGLVELAERDQLPVSLIYDELVAVFREFRFSGTVFDMMMKTYVERRLVKNALYMFDNMPKCGRVPSLRSCNGLLSCLVRFKDFHVVYCVYDQMVRVGVAPDVYTCAIMVDAYCKDGKVARALEFVLGMESMGLKMNIVGYNSLINGYVEKRDMQGVEKVLELIRQQGISKNLVTYTLLIKGYCKTGNLDQADRVLRQMKEGTGLELVLDEKVYGVLIDGYCRNGRLDDAERVKNEMLSLGLGMNMFIFNSLINGYCKLGKLREAELVIVSMVEANLKPDGYSYNTLLDGYCKRGMIDEALKLCHKMTRDGVCPTNISYNTLLKGLCEHGDMNDALSLWETMLKRGLIPDEVGFSTLLHGLFSRGNYKKAFTLWKHVLARGYARSTVLCNAMLNGLCKMGKMIEAEQILEKMMQMGCLPDGVTNRTLIDGYCRAGDISRAFQIKEAMDAEGIPASLEMYNSLIQGLFQAHKSNEVSHMLSEVHAKALSPNIITYGALISGWFKEGNLKKAFDAYFEMRGKGISPNVYICSTIISGLNRLGRTDEANMLVQKMVDLDVVPDLKRFYQSFNFNTLQTETQKVASSLDKSAQICIIPNNTLYNVVISCLCKSGKIDDAKKAIGDLLQRGFTPDEFTYSTLIHTASISGAIDEAFLLRDEMVKKDEMQKEGLATDSIRHCRSFEDVAVAAEALS